MERAERFVLLGVGLAFDILVPVLWVMLVLTAVTAVHRFVMVWRQAASARRDAPPPPVRDPRGAPARLRTGRRRVRRPTVAPPDRRRTAAGADLARVLRAHARRSRGPASVAVRRDGVRLAGRAARRSSGIAAAPAAAGCRARSSNGRSSAVFDGYGRYWLEIFRLPDESAASIDAHFDVRGLRAHRGGRARGQGRDPRPPAPRRLGVGGRVARDPGLPPARRRRAGRAAGAPRVVRRDRAADRHGGRAARSRRGWHGAARAARQPDRVPALRPRPRR